MDLSGNFLRLRFGTCDEPGVRTCGPSFLSAIESPKDWKGLRASRWICSRQAHSSFADISHRDLQRRQTIELSTTRPADWLTCGP